MLASECGGLEKHLKDVQAPLNNQGWEISPCRAQESGTALKSQEFYVWVRCR